MKDLKYFKTKDFHSALRHFFKSLNVPVNYIAEESARPQRILSERTYKEDKEAFQLMDDVYFLGMVDDAAFEGGQSLDYRKIESDYDGILIFGVTLHPRDNGLPPTRTQLAEITRAFNQEFHYTPVVVVFRYANALAFANAERLKYKQEWREGEKAGKVSLLRDVDIDNTHRGHWDILMGLAINRPGKQAVNSFASLYAYWQTVFNVSLLNKKFYEELSNWYFWAIKEVTFPDEPTAEDVTKETGKMYDQERQEELRHEHNAKNVIRLLTRFLFVWFIKEKKLIPPELFQLDYVKNELVKDLSPYHQRGGLFQSLNRKSHYYKAILQNLFFATLNQEMSKRGFRKDKQHMNVTNLLRYETCFKSPQKFIDLVEAVVPFMNGGLFECLDKPHPTQKGLRGGDVIIYEDGFSDRDDNPLVVPDYLFFGLDEEVDLSQVIGIANKKTQRTAVKGLINIFEYYKFTIAENTPIEEDIALDPELLGKVFENLLASYNPETKTTARKQTGSFYTPREIVNYMVDESLIAYLKNVVPDWGMDEKELDDKLHQLLSFDPGNPFAENTDLEKAIIKAIDTCSILDPACGSGAFPMGILQKMVHVLQKLDPDNSHWHDLQMKKALTETESAFHLGDKDAREQKLLEINEAFDQQVNDPDYARKLFLIENCIYGVDIQPIAAQISKLRFFISLVVDQKVDKAKENFGIRPLPNLETKFVAANTLVGIEKPDKRGHLFANQEIKELEEELKKVRHRIFSAKTPKTKRKLRDKDQALREKMGELLIADGWANKTARQLAAWDPYDQNMSSPFFDLEWMFGMKDGFDVVIGNPPYIDSEMMANTGQEKLRSYISGSYQLAKGNWDIYIAFFENGFNCLNENGVLTYITPDKWLTKPFGKELRKNLLKNLHILLRSGRSVFESVGVDSIVTVFKKQTEDYFSFFDCIDNNFVKINNIDKKIILDPYQLDIVFSKHINLLINITRKNKALVDYGVLCENACATSDAYILKEILENRCINDIEFIRKKYLKVINTGTVDKFTSRWGLKEMTYLKDKYLHPVVNKNEFLKTFPNTYGKKALMKKIIIKGLTLLDASIDKFGFFIPGKSTLIIAEPNLAKLYYIAIIINSYFAQFYITERYSASSYNTGVNFTKDMINNLPVPSLSFKEELIYLFVIILCFAKEKPVTDSDTYIFESISNGLVFELYFPKHMREKQIDILQFVEKDLTGVMKGRDFEQLPDSEKETVINQLHARWTHPDSEVRNRIKLFAVRSPDILKPILESR